MKFLVISLAIISLVLADEKVAENQSKEPEKTPEPTEKPTQNKRTAPPMGQPTQTAFVLYQTPNGQYFTSDGRIIDAAVVQQIIAGGNPNLLNIGLGLEPLLGLGISAGANGADIGANIGPLGLDINLGKPGLGIGIGAPIGVAPIGIAPVAPAYPSPQYPKPQPPAYSKPGVPPSYNAPVQPSYRQPAPATPIVIVSQQPPQPPALPSPPTPPPVVSQERHCVLFGRKGECTSIPNFFSCMRDGGVLAPAISTCSLLQACCVKGLFRQ